MSRNFFYNKRIKLEQICIITVLQDQVALLWKYEKLGRNYKLENYEETSNIIISWRYLPLLVKTQDVDHRILALQQPSKAKEKELRLRHHARQKRMHQKRHAQWKSLWQPLKPKQIIYKLVSIIGVVPVLWIEFDNQTVKAN